MNLSFFKTRLIRWILVCAVFLTAAGGGVYYYTNQGMKLTFHPDWTETDRKQIREIMSWLEIRKNYFDQERDEAWNNMVDSLSFESIKNVGGVWKQFQEWRKDYNERNPFSYLGRIIERTARTGDARYVEKDNWSLLHLACGLGKKELACHLMEKGANVNSRYQGRWGDELVMGDMPLHYLLAGGLDTGNIRLDVGTTLFLMDKIAAHGADFNALPAGGTVPPLALFCVLGRGYTEEGQEKILSKMIDLGTDVVSPVRWKGKSVSSFYFPMQSNLPLLVRCLCKAGTDVNEGYDSLPPLFLLYHNWPHKNMYEMARLLLDHGARVNEQIRRIPNNCPVKMGQTPLSFLCFSFDKYPLHDEKVKKSYLDAFFLLLERKADVNLPSAEGMTPLMYLFKDKKLNGDWDTRVELARVLLRHGANPSLENNKGETVLDMIRTYPKQGERILKELPALRTVK